MKQKILLIGGATAVGKSAFALDLSKHLNMEIISADSVQVYKDLYIGTSKPTKSEQEQCKHHLVDIIDFSDNFNAYNFVQLAKEKIDEITKRKKLPVIVGGTGLYIENRLYDFDFDKKTRSEESRYDYLLYVLNQDRNILYQKINSRVDCMIANGLVDEIKSLKDMGFNETLQSAQAIGYKQILQFLNGKIELKEAIEQTKKATRNYAKRQITWFKHMNPTWVDVDKNLDEAKKEIIEKYKDYKI